MPKGQCKFNSTFLRDKRFKDWLVAVPGKNTEGKCKLCTSEFSTSYGCKSAILSHANGQSHKHLVKAQENAQRSLAPMYFIYSKTSTPNNSRSEQDSTGTATSIGATSTGATSTGATSTGATSTGETSTGATSTGATSTGATSTGATSTGATSTGATSTGATSTGATSTGTTSTGATSTGATSTGATSTGATSTGATSTGATSTGATSTGTTSTGATSTGATSTGATSTSTDSTTTDLQPSLSTTKHQLVVDDILNDALNAHAEICWVLKVASCYFSYCACLDLSKLFQIMFKDSKIAHYFKMSKRKCMYFLKFGLAPRFKRFFLMTSKHLRILVYHLMRL